MDKVVIIGAGAAGLSAAIHLAEENVPSTVISEMPSGRVQSNMAEGGINAALNTMGQDDTPALHEAETYKAGRFLACREAVHRLTHAAPDIVRTLFDWGMSLNLTETGQIAQRAFGGQSKKRTAFASASTGKQLMFTLTTKARMYEARGMIESRIGWRFLKLVERNGRAQGVLLANTNANQIAYVPASGVILASGGMNGLFGNATGSVLNKGNVTASLFAEGLPLGNLEMIQYHPTTTRLHGKNMLITEAVRGEGGRLYVEQNGERLYFMEEKYPELGNLMPRDVVAREEWYWIKQGIQPWLDMRDIPAEVSKNKLAGVLDACHDFLSLDPLQAPIPVSPGIHYFMGGIYVDVNHRTRIRNLYAAGEAACQYHGANRLGANSLLGAIAGGRTAADAAMDDLHGKTSSFQPPAEWLAPAYWLTGRKEGANLLRARKQLNLYLQKALGMERNETDLLRCLAQVEQMEAQIDGGYDSQAPIDENVIFPHSLLLAKAILHSALERKESRGAHTRSDYPGEREEYRKTTLSVYTDKAIRTVFQPIEGD
ncbi:MAG: FAD-binding protein [Acidaminococcaceae bacterium]|nr:FAD-binding protein [Acidaminococcaceae bacterium]